MEHRYQLRGLAVPTTPNPQPDADSVCAQAREVVEFCGQKFPHVADYLEESPDALLAFYYCTETGMNQDLV